MDNNTLLFQEKGSGRYKDVKIYPNRIEVLKKGTFGGKHTEIVYLKDITGVNRIKGRDVFLRNRLLTACVFSLSSRAKAQEFVNALIRTVRATRARTRAENSPTRATAPALPPGSLPPP